MNAKGLILLLAAVAIGAASSAVTYWTLCGRKAISQASLSEAAFLTRELGLSPAQAQEIGKQQAAMGTQLAECCARHCAARTGLGQALADGSNAQARAQALIAEMGRAYMESELLTWEHIRQVRALLTPTQQARYDALVKRCLCGGCNMEK